MNTSYGGSMMPYDTDYDSLILFSFDTAQEIAAGLRENNWAEETYNKWAKEGMGMIGFMLLGDMPQSQVRARMSAITATKQDLIAQAKLYVNTYRAIKDSPAGVQAWKELSKLVNLKNFKEICLEKEALVMSLLNSPDEVMDQVTKKKIKP